MGPYPDEGQGLFRKRLMKIAPYNAFRPSTPDLGLHPGRHADTLRYLSSRIGRNSLRRSP